ncbi:hypothetical protein SAMN04488072_1072 [Lentibacillus halodurans]|uniref:Poly(Glycerol-phosphate) alpha-glucosyltransferase n=1 Tax=Lentibacillus halodurans TaxID=237679 RepID=A0A1I0YAC8_9BACI|nr:hypothetical protein [Lentibacillus halodurans]SFB10142.1 hypothetical protein SAMN04488072_1072 [Lentibacillus halodurans]
MSFSRQLINNTQAFQEKADILYDFIKSKNDFKKFIKKTAVHLFCSLGYQHRRAIVVHASKIGFDEAWRSLMKKIEKQSHEVPSYIKIDIVTNKKPVNILSFINLMTKTKKNYLRFGISFDKDFNYAFLEQEINGNAMIQFDKDKKRGYLKEENIQNYIKRHRPDMKQIDFRKVTNVQLFSTKGYFYDGDQCYKLKEGTLDNGRRDTPLEAEEIRYMVTSGQTYLNALNQYSGKFNYGYFSCFDKEIKLYDMLRHASTVYALIESYEFAPTDETKKVIERSLYFLETDGIYYDGNTRAYMIDGVDPAKYEIKLSANAAAILALTKYTEVFHDDKYLPLAQALANGIVSLQKNDGSFVHVLHYPSMDLKENFRTVHYDGKTAFALMRLYKLDGDIEWLTTVEKAFEYFIGHDYWKHHDHWLSYCANELTYYRSLEKYFKFGLENTKGKLSFVYNHETTYPTFLELKLATYHMIARIRETGHTHLLESFNEDQLLDVIHRRAEYQRNGFFYPELAIYYKNPARIVGSFFIRHHSFRSRIDDVEHNLSGYIAYYNTFCRS